MDSEKVNNNETNYIYAHKCICCFLEINIWKSEIREVDPYERFKRFLTGLI